MIEQRGRVVALSGDEARVRLGGQSGCAACDAGRGCGAGLFGRLLQRGDTEVTVVNRLGLAPGAPVTLGIAESDYLALVMALFGWPLLAALAGAALAHALAAPALGGSPWALDVATAAGGLAAGAAVLWRGRRSMPDRFTRLSLQMLAPSDDLECVSSERHP